MAEFRSQQTDSSVSTSSANFRKVVHEALKNLRRDFTTTSPLHLMRLFKVASQEHQGNSQAATRHVLDRGIQQLATKLAVEARILRQHFFEGKAIQTIAAELNMAEGTVYNKQSEAITHLADLLNAREAQVRHDYHHALAARLPLPANNALVGISHHLTHLVDLLCTPSAPWLIALAGIGGIGKTTLADAVARQAILREHFDDIGWVTAKQQVFSGQGGLRELDQPALSTDALIRTLLTQLLPTTPLTPTMTRAELQALLRTHLGRRPYLIVIDNLETLTDIETLLDTLRDLANPTKFLLTARTSFFHEADVYHFPVPELSQALALHLVRQEAQIRNLPELRHASDSDLQPIVETVGGNPLAIRLVVGQLHLHALEVILENLRAARGQTMEQFYTYIYRQAWDALDETARRVLLVMPLVSHLGGSLDHICKVSGIDIGAVTDALGQLIHLSLVDSRGDLKSRRYTIHNLTATFLQEQVIRWGAPQ